MTALEFKEEKFGIPWCINCAGMHPDHMPSFKDYARRMINPNREAWVQWSQFHPKAALYKNKSCMLCGRTYDENGNWEDDTDKCWDRTAVRVREELIRAGLFGVDDDKVKMVVARCRKSVTFLFQNRFHMNPRYWDRFSFAGALALIITHAQEARARKLGSMNDIQGPVR